MEPGTQSALHIRQATRGAGVIALAPAIDAQRDTEPPAIVVDELGAGASSAAVAAETEQRARARGAEPPAPKLQRPQRPGLGLADVGTVIVRPVGN